MSTWTCRCGGRSRWLGVRIGEDVAGHGHAVRRGHAAVPGKPEHLQPPTADPGPTAGRGPDRPPSCRAGPAAAPAGTGAAQHGRHHVRGTQCAAPDDVTAGLAPVPERPPRRAVDCHAQRGDRLPSVRRAFRASQRRILRLQLLRRVPACQGLGVRSEVEVSTLVPDPDKTIAEGAVLPWNSGGRRLSMYAAGELGVRLDVPYRSLTDHERDIVLHGEPVRRQVRLRSGRTGRAVQLSVNYDNAVAAVERSLRSDNERTRRLVQRFLITRVCSVCHGTRLRPEALTSRLGGRDIAEISALGLGELRGFAAGLTTGLPAELSRLTTGLLAELTGTLTPLLDVGLGYLTLERPGASLSTGERQRIELTSTVRASTTGMLYVLDEPSVGLHPVNVQGLRKTITALAANGNSVVVVEHERELIRAADWVIELGPGAGATGGTVMAQGTPGQLETDPHSIMGPFLAGAMAVPRERPSLAGPGGQIAIEIGDLYNLHN